MEISEESVLADPSTSNWLKQAIQTTQSRDCVDAINDVEILQKILYQRFTSLTGYRPNIENRVTSAD